MLVVLVFAVVMAGAYYWLVHRPLHEQLRGLDETEVRLLFRKLRNQLRLDFEGAQSELTSIAKRDVIRGFDPVQLDKALAQEEQTTTFYKKFTIMDMNGRVVSRPSIPSSNGLDRSDRGYFRGPLGNNGLYIDDVRPFGHGLSVSLSVPVVGLDGKTCGVLAGQVELTGKSPRLCKTTTGWPSRSKHEVILISRKGFKVGHSTGPLDATTLAEVDMLEHPLFPLAGRNSKGSVYSVGGVEYYGIACKVASVGLGPRAAGRAGPGDRQRRSCRGWHGPRAGTGLRGVARRRCVLRVEDDPTDRTVDVFVGALR
jgi:hypothetical protein